MPNSSSTGGYILPTYEALPGGLTLDQFIQQFISNITGIAPSNVRPKWQENPPKQLPNPSDIWCSFGINTNMPDADAYVQQGASTQSMQRHEELSIDCSFYGDMTNAQRLRDGAQLTQNRDVLRSAKMNFKEVSQIITAPDLIGEKWFKKYDVTLVLRRQVNSTFAVAPFVSAAGSLQGQQDSGTIATVNFTVSNV